ncbi:MAG: phosphomethylpyrimidine synthase [Deltaproteobacteria bacterium DG_8]|nr:MAG: phosphomethylpyrimidine synthase [Deltaproteobacteria bacterium DG_8]
MNQLEQVRKGLVTKAIEEVASSEGIDPQFIVEEMVAGHIIIPRNKHHTSISPIGIGKGLRTKINANIGTSKDHQDIEEELKKLQVAIESGADTVMDLSTGGSLDEIRRAITEKSTVPIGTVPIYQAVVETVRSKKAMVHMSEDLIFKVIEKQAEEGVDFITVHCGLTRESAARLKREGRVMDVVSRGGAFTIEWMAYNKKENPLYEHYDRLLEIAHEYDITLSLGDGLRPGCLADATDRGQVQELIILGELAERAWAKDVQVMIEGPGHIPIHQIAVNVQLQKQLCHGAPFYVLGPLVTDIAPGYDHITSAIGGSIAASAGADFLCYVTPSEHLRLPTVEDVKIGVIASKIAAHAADITKSVKGALEKDIKMAQCRKALDWDQQIKLSIDPALADHLRSSSKPTDKDVCTMCGEFCAIKLLSKEERWKYFDNF